MEFVGYPVQEARDAEGKRKGQKRETRGRFFDMLPGLDTTFNDLTTWYLDLKQVKRLVSYKSIRCVLGLFNEDFGEKLVHTLKPQELEAYQDKRRGGRQDSPDHRQRPAACLRDDQEGIPERHD